MNVKIAVTTEQNLLISHFQLSDQWKVIMGLYCQSLQHQSHSCLIHKDCYTILQTHTGDRQHIKAMNTHLFSSLYGGQIYTEITQKG